ncbi:MAG: fatty acid desaturase family protein [Calditrichia bacterium]
MNSTHYDADQHPLTHQDVRREISRGIEDEIAALRGFSIRKRLLEIGFFVLMMSIGIAVVIYSRGLLPDTAGYVGWFAGTVLAALAINALVLLMHEGMHNILFRNPQANRWTSFALGTTFLMSFTAYKVLHIRHHDHLGGPGDLDDYHNYSDSDIIVWSLHYMRLFIGSFLYILLIPRFAYKYGSKIERQHIVVEYLLLFIFYSALLWIIPGDILFWAWFVPLVIVGYMINIRGFTQHGITDAHDPYLASRSIYPNRLISFLLLNENLHLEHHLFPEIPSYHLPELNRLIGPRLPRKVVGKSYLGFLFTFFRRTLRLDESVIGLEKKD